MFSSVHLPFLGSPHADDIPSNPYQSCRETSRFVISVRRSRFDVKELTDETDPDEDELLATRRFIPRTEGRAPRPGANHGFVHLLLELHGKGQNEREDFMDKTVEPPVATQASFEDHGACLQCVRTYAAIWRAAEREGRAARERRWIRQVSARA